MGVRLQVRRVYEEPSADDGRRVLVDRLWPRGITKERAALDAWERDLAPSTELRRWYGHDPERFGEFSARYRQELDASPAAIAFAEGLRDEEGTVTLLCSARDAAHSNAEVLRGWLLDRLDEAGRA